MMKMILSIQKDYSDISNNNNISDDDDDDADANILTTKLLKVFTCI